MPSINQRPRTFTFYSYKGGVGRSMALLNVAYSLHARGRHVLMVDLDLEAPGVSGFLHRKDELVSCSEDGPDVVDLLTEIMPIAKWELGCDSRPDLPKLSPFIREVKTESYAPARNDSFNRARLDVLAASEERNYTERLGNLGMAQYSGEDLARAGEILREIMFSHGFEWSYLDGDEKSVFPYDYILIDSRTGFTETGGLCIGPLADRLVVFCGLNDQNISGTAEFLKTVGLKTGKKQEPWDDADPVDDDDCPPLLIDKPSIIVASPVPYGEMEMKKSRFAAMKEALGVSPAASITYHPRLALFETIFSCEDVDEPIIGEYDKITNHLMKMVKDHPVQLMGEFIRKKDREDKEKVDLSRLARLTISNTSEENTGLSWNYVSHGNFCGNRAKDSEGKDAELLFEEAYENYQAALVVSPGNHEALVGWGNRLGVQAKEMKGKKGDALFERAYKKYGEALANTPNRYLPLFNWGTALSNQAELKTGEEADILFERACEKYVEALANQPGDRDALKNWGHTLYSQAERKAGEQADVLYEKAYEKYGEALKVKPDDLDVLNHWGAALSSQAKEKKGEEANILFERAYAKFTEALAIKPDDPNVIFNISCYYALRGQVEKCLQELKRSIKCGERVTQKVVRDDSDFERVRDDKVFQDFVNSLEP